MQQYKNIQPSNKRVSKIQSNIGGSLMCSFLSLVVVIFMFECVLRNACMALRVL